MRLKKSSKNLNRHKGRVGLFICGHSGLDILQALLQEHVEIAGVLVLVQKSHELHNFTDRIVSLCQRHHMYVKTTDEVKPASYASFLKKISADTVFVIDWRYLIPEDCFMIPRNGIFVLHDSLLPKYRGFAPANWVVINGEKETGVTMQRIHEKTDAGNIVAQKRIRLAVRETATTLNEKIRNVYPDMILRNLPAIEKGSIRERKQDERLATYGCKRSPEDGKIDFSKSTIVIDRLIRGLSYPYPGAFCVYKGERVLIWEAEPLKHPPVYVGRISGKIVATGEKYVDVLTGEGVLRILSCAYSREPERMLVPREVFTSISHTLT